MVAYRSWTWCWFASRTYSASARSASAARYSASSARACSEPADQLLLSTSNMRRAVLTCQRVNRLGVRALERPSGDQVHLSGAQGGHLGHARLR
jgi:hypothetical protein